MVRPIIYAISLVAIASVGSVSQARETTRDARNREFIAKNYPPGALKRGEQGRVSFKITIEPDGSLGSCEVTKSSGFAGLDNETCEIMIFNARLKPVRDKSGRAVRSSQEGYINWTLPKATDVIANASVAAMPPPDEVICKRSAKAGSLIAKTKQCMTREDWLRSEQSVRDLMDNLQFRGHSGSLPGG